MDLKRNKIKFKNSIKSGRAIDLNQEHNHKLRFSNRSLWKETL